MRNMCRAEGHIVSLKSLLNVLGVKLVDIDTMKEWPLNFKCKGVKQLLCTEALHLFCLIKL